MLIFKIFIRISHQNLLQNISAQTNLHPKEKVKKSISIISYLKLLIPRDYILYTIDTLVRLEDISFKIISSNNTEKMITHIHTYTFTDRTEQSKPYSETCNRRYKFQYFREQTSFQVKQ